MKSLSCVQLFATPQTVVYQAPPSMGFPRQEYWSGFPFPSPGDLPDPGIEPGSPALQADILLSEPPVKSRVSSYRKDFAISLLNMIFVIQYRYRIFFETKKIFLYP